MPLLTTDNENTSIQLTDKAGPNSLRLITDDKVYTYQLETRDAADQWKPRFFRSRAEPGLVVAS